MNAIKKKKKNSTTALLLHCHSILEKVYFWRKIFPEKQRFVPRHIKIKFPPIDEMQVLHSRSFADATNFSKIYNVSSRKREELRNFTRVLRWLKKGLVVFKLEIIKTNDHIMEKRDTVMTTKILEEFLFYLSLIIS